MSIAISAIGIANPEYKRRQQDAADLITTGFNLKPAQKRLLKSIYKSTGIEYRYSVLSDYCKKPGEFEFFPNEMTAPFPSTGMRMQVYKKYALPLAIQAIQNCLTSNKLFELNDITHLITVSCTGMYAPGIDIEIIQQLNLNSTTRRTAINFMGCYGAFNAMRMAHEVCSANPTSKILIVCIELCTIHFQQNMSVDNIVSNAIFADGAAAIIIESNPENKKSLSLVDFHCDLLPQSKQEMAWHISDSGFDIVLSSYVPDMIESGILNFTNRLLHKNTLNFADIDFYAIHPGGAKILQACEKALNITENDNRYSYDVLKNYGNMSSVTVIFVLKQIWDSLNNNDQNKHIFSCAFGPGLTLESLLLKVHVA